MRLVLALLLASEPALAAISRGPGQGGPARGAPVPRAGSVVPSLGIALPLGVVLGPTAGYPAETGAIPIARPSTGLSKGIGMVPVSAGLPTAGPDAARAEPVRLVERLGEAAESSLATVEAAASAPAEASSASGERDFAVLLGEAPPPVVPAGGGGGGAQDPYPGSLKRMFAGTMAFKVGMEAMTTSVPFVAMSSLGGATAVALLVVVTYGLAQAVFSSFTGALTDRFPARRVLTGAVAAQGISLGAILALSAAGALSPWMLFPLYALVGGAVGVAETARRLIPALILGRDEEALPRYNARLHRFYEIAGVAGSALAGLLIWKFGAMNALIVGPPALLLAALIFRGVRHGAPSKPAAGPAPSAGGLKGAREAVARYFRDLGLGAGTVLRDPRLRWVAVAMIFPQIVHRIFEGMLLPIYAKGVLGQAFLSPALLTASNLGEFLGATLLLRWAAKRPGAAPWVRWGAYGLLGLWALSLVQALAVSPLVGVALLALPVLVSSLTWAASHLSLETEVQARVPREVQPRVFSLLYGAFVVLAAASSYLIGRFLDAVPLAAGFLWLNAALVLLAALVWFASRRLATPPANKAG